MTSNHHEGLRTARLLMVMSSLSPLFVLWAIRGNPLIPDGYLIAACCVIVVLPNLFLWLRILTARQLNEKRDLHIATAEDHRDHLLVYLFAILLPFYAATLSTWRDLAALLVALAFITFLFWHLNLHYMNLLFAIKGYRVFTVAPGSPKNPLSGKGVLVLITRRPSIPPDTQVIAYRLSDTVYWEEG